MAAAMGLNLICMAPSRMGKTTAFVFTTLQHLSGDPAVQCMVLCHNRELAWEISKEYSRLAKYLPHAKCAVFGDFFILNADRELLKSANIIVGTPAILSSPALSCLPLTKLKYFILDEADKMLEHKKEMLEIYKKMPTDVQVMINAETTCPAVLKIARAVMQSGRPLKEVYMDADGKVILHGTTP